MLLPLITPLTEVKGPEDAQVDRQYNSVPSSLGPLMGKATRGDIHLIL